MTMVYEYWCEPCDRAERERAFVQLRAAGDAYRALVDVVNERRRAVRPVARKLMGLRACATAFARDPRRREIATAGVERCRGRIRAIEAAWRQAEHHKAIYARLVLNGPLYWTGWGAVREAVMQADREITTKDLHPRRWDSVVTQVNRPLRADQVIGGDHTQFQIGADFVNKRVGGARKLQIAKLRVGSDGPGGRIPIWLSVYVLVHRPLPPDCQVKTVRVLRKTIGTMTRWRLQITVDASYPTVTHPHPDRTVGVDLGWRHFDDGTVRLAYAWGSDQVADELRLPAKVVGRTKHEDLRGIRDRNANAMRMQLADHGMSIPGNAGIRWLHHAARQPDAPAALIAWAKQDRHLHDWEDANRAKLRRQVAGMTRQWAAQLANRYAVIAVENISTKVLRESEDLHGRIAGRAARFAPGFVLEALKHAGAKRGCRVVIVEQADTTRTCTHCGTVHEVGAPLVTTCPACHREDDQDRRAAEQIMHRATEPIRDASTPRSRKQLGTRVTRRKPVLATAAATTEHAE